jgi:LytS/YehU family sensor histidine kinase
LNLADVFRYLLRSDRTFIEIEEELKIVRAYLEIEELRLGTKLRTELDVDESVLRATIPLLSIQPLVENAVKHGVASKAGRGFVRLSIRQEPGGVAVSISNSGECDPAILATSGGGVGLANVRRRLALCYGAQTRIEAKAIDGVTTVGFLLPRTRVPGLAVAAARV